MLAPASYVAGCELLLLFVVLRHQEWHRAWVLEQPAA